MRKNNKHKLQYTNRYYGCGLVQWLALLDHDQEVLAFIPEWMWMDWQFYLTHAPTH